ncbi:MAG: hypothetical protein D6824_09620, partial [Planctomycetota bacterium]
MMHWTNPADNIDGTPMDDFAGIHLYEDGALAATFTRSSADTGAVDSALYSPPAGTHQYHVTAFDNESPPNESDPSNIGYSPLALPFFDDFPTIPDPNPGFWINTTAEVTSTGVNPPSPPYELTLDGHPNGGDMVTLLPVDLSGLAGQGVVLSFWYQPQGTGNAPEAGDSLAVDFLNSLGQWRTVREWPGTPLTPFANEVISLDGEDPGPGATFFHPAFQFRFRSLGTASSTSHFDHWMIDDVFLGLPTNDPVMVVTPLNLVDTLLIGATEVLHFEVRNANPQPSSLNFTITETPPVDWLAANPTSGTLASNSAAAIDVTVDAATLTAGTHTAQLVVVGNDPANPADTVTVTVVAEEAPIIGVNPDSIYIFLHQGGIDSVPLTLTNSGGGTLHFSIRDEEVFPGSALEPQPKPYETEYGLDLDKGEVDRRHGVT